MQQSGCKRLRGRRAGFHLARVPRRPGLLRGAEPTALPPDWKLLGGGSQSRLHYGRCPALSRWLKSLPSGGFSLRLSGEGGARRIWGGTRVSFAFPFVLQPPPRFRAAPGHARTSRLARWKPVSAHRPRRSGTRKGAGHGVERAKVPKRSWASRTGATSWAFLHCTHLHSPSEDGLLRRTQLTLLLDWAELSEVESRQSDEAVAFSVRLGDHNFDNCALRNAAEILQSPPLRGLPRGDAEGLGKEEGRRHSLAGPPRGGRPAEHWRAGAWTTSPTEEDPEAF
ncbi:uncharacterized protein [Tursiops truncatus]|uniref:uncharacterized protein n=1 Tax=Tursiops truncatus TaxID=9739 RepID=UPI003CCF625D